MVGDRNDGGGPELETVGGRQAGRLRVTEEERRENRRQGIILEIILEREKNHQRVSPLTPHRDGQPSSTTPSSENTSAQLATDHPESSFASNIECPSQAAVAIFVQEPKPWSRSSPCRHRFLHLFRQELNNPPLPSTSPTPPSHITTEPLQEPFCGPPHSHGLAESFHQMSTLQSRATLNRTEQNQKESVRFGIVGKNYNRFV